MLVEEISKSEMTRRMKEACEELRLQSPICEKCGRETLLTIDHIIPMSLLTDFGIDYRTSFDKDNLRVLCKPCNMIKASHLDFSTPKTKELLIAYMKRLSGKTTIPKQKPTDTEVSVKRVKEWHD